MLVTRPRIDCFALTALILLSWLMACPAAIHAEKYSGESFTLGVGGRTLALGGAGAAGPFDASTAYWNPAGMNSLSGRYVTMMHGETFGSLLNHEFISYVDARPRDAGTIRSFGFYLYYLGGGGIDITAMDPGQRPEVVREESHGDLLLGGSVAGKIGERLDVGLTGKFLYRDISTETGWGLSLDAGAVYVVGPDVQLGLMITDITSGFIRYSGKTFNIPGHSESISPAVKPGLSVTHRWSEWIARGAVSGDIRFDGLREAAQYWSGELSLDMHYGLEVGYHDMVFGRVGADIGRLTAGLGVEYRHFSFDVAYLNHPDLDETIRFSAGYQFR